MGAWRADVSVWLQMQEAEDIEAMLSGKELNIGKLDRSLEGLKEQDPI